MKKISFAVITSFIFALCLSSFAQDGGRTGITWKVQKYDLDVTLPHDEGARIVSAKAVLNIKNVSGKPASTLTLRISTTADVTSVKVNDATVDFTKSEEKISATMSLQRIVTRITSVAADGQINATVEYKLNVKENSALSAVSPVFAQFLPLSYWYPTPNSWYFTQGPDAAPIRIKVNVPTGQNALSSGSYLAGINEQKLSAQPFFFSGNWDVLDQSGVFVFMPKGSGVDAQKRAAELAALMSEARAFVLGLLGRSVDVPMKIIASRRGAGFSSGGVVVVDEAVFRRSKIDSSTAMNIAEAVAKTWIGGAASITGEGYGAIGEGLARYIATQFIESKYGKDVADIERLRQRTSYAAVSKRDAPLAKASPLDDFYYPEVANKGAMLWRLLAKRLGTTEFFNIIGKNMQDGNLNLAELRTAFSAQKDLLDYFLDQVTDMNLLVGLPQVNGGETKIALRNTGAFDVVVDVTATTDNGQRLSAPTAIRAASFGEVVFKTNSKIVRVEIDSDKLYPQAEYSDDVAPRETTDSDPVLAAKRLFDKQDFVNAESTARKLLRDLPRCDDLRILLARSLLAQNKNTDAETEFKAVLEEKLPAARSLALANVGLAEVAARSNRKDAALKYAEAAIIADADYGASIAARNLRNNLGSASTGELAIKMFFSDFDKAALSNRKANVDALVMPGEVAKFAGGISGSTEQWQTSIRQIDHLDANTVLVETNMNIKLLNKNAESGMAVYRLAKTPAGWKMSAVEAFEVR